jgi:hypothetical protein
MSAELPYVYAAILDVLGYRQRLDADRQMGTLGFKDDLQAALQVLTEVNEAEVAYQAISDTVILTCPKRETFLDFLKVIKNVQIAFLRRKLFVRGGLTYAQHFKSTHVTYSHALSSAYEIEKGLAIYPRIVVDHNIIEMFRDAGELQPIVDSMLVCVCNGTFFVNIIDDHNWQEIYDYGRQLFLHDVSVLFRKEPEFSKHVWFENYLFGSPFNPFTSDRYIPGVSYNF